MLAVSTWGDIVPVVHYSESRNIEQEDDSIRPQAHSDYVYDYIDTYGNKVDIINGLWRVRGSTISSEDLKLMLPFLKKDFKGRG